jgi:hypothetical protein
MDPNFPWHGVRGPVLCPTPARLGYATFVPASLLITSMASASLMPLDTVYPECGPPLRMDNVIETATPIPILTVIRAV